MPITTTHEHDSAGLSLLAGARHTSRTEKAFSLALVLRGIERIGASVLRSTGA